LTDPGSTTGISETGTGALCLDFTNTLDWRTSDHPDELLGSYADLLAWGQKVGALDQDQAKQLLAQSHLQPEATARVLDRAIALREAIYRIFSTLLSGSVPSRGDLDILNSEQIIAGGHLSLTWNDARIRQVWTGDPNAFDRMLWPVARSAADLLTSNEHNRVGECAGEGCGWLFLDTSKNHTRRWCSMNDCGNRAKVRKYYQRKHNHLSG
jgi:predicted RNA-binding Zn ribbon-like protein